MAKPPKIYQRLTRPRSGLGSYASLWMAADHLMVVTSVGFSESYQRYFFRDIQAFFVLKSSRYFYFNLVAGLITFLTGLWAGVGIVQAGGWDAGPTAIMFVFVPALAVLITNLIKGSSCQVKVITALQKTELAPLSRQRKTRKVMAKIEPLIREAQQRLATTGGGEAKVAPAAVEAEPEVVVVRKKVGSDDGDSSPPPLSAS